MAQGRAGQGSPIVLWGQQVERGHSEVLRLPPQPAVEWQDLAFLPSAEYIFYLQRRLFFWALTHLATTVLT